MALTGLIVAYEAYEASTDADQLLSAAADRWIESSPIGARVAIVTVGVILTAHVANLVPQPDRFDVMSTGFWRRLTR